MLAILRVRYRIHTSTVVQRPGVPQLTNLSLRPVAWWGRPTQIASGGRLLDCSQEHTSLCKPERQLRGLGSLGSDEVVVAIGANLVTRLEGKERRVPSLRMHL